MAGNEHLELDNTALAEVVIAVACAMSEQLDLGRLLAALKIQHDQYAGFPEPGAQAVAQHLRRIGSALTQVAALREKSGGAPPH